MSTVRERIGELLVKGIIHAWIGGKTVQYKSSYLDWTDSATGEKWPSFDAEGFEWRIKPEPREVWLWIDDVIGLPNGKTIIEARATEPYPHKRFRKFVEVPL